MPEQWEKDEFLRDDRHLVSDFRIKIILAVLADPA